MKTGKNYFQVLYNILTIVGAGIITLLLSQPFVDGHDNGKAIIIVLLFGEIFVLTNAAQHFYDVTLFVYLDRHFKIITKSFVIATTSTAFVLFVLQQSRFVFLFTGIFVMAAYILMGIGLVPGIWLQQMTRQKNAARTAFVGNFYEFQKANYYINKNSVRINQRGYILKDKNDDDGTFHVLGMVEELERIIKDNDIQMIYFIQKMDADINGLHPSSELQPYIDICSKQGVIVKILIDSDALAFSGNISAIGTYPEITIHP